jgi:hypothetical protein
LVQSHATDRRTKRKYRDPVRLRSGQAVHSVQDDDFKEKAVRYHSIQDAFDYAQGHDDFKEEAVGYIHFGFASLRGDDPLGVGVEEEEENHAERHEIHIDQEKDAAVVEAPSALHAADGVNGAGECDEDGEHEKRSGVIVRKAGKQEGSGQAGQDEETAAEKRTRTRIEKAGAHAISR